MNEILKKRIDEKLKRAENRLIASEQPYDAKFLAAVHELVIRATEFALKNQWISVDKALPDCRINVIGRCRDGRIYVMRRCDYGTFYDWDVPTDIPPNALLLNATDVTHWMPIPEI